ncbi:indolepyruvate ferredoxin oxidoreductase subunit alpha [Desulfotomaculum sp. 1211_IL3151]|uniref:indolepyruvate ferredoxin oxidoreductase subunit alpha n=1 Tax=Desulfotomaculum sp. 1211_IL3151 TaxID=3084055 RepID=UPI002FDB4CEC
MKKLLSGNEALARGAYEAGVRFASAYPGTPSTEILENMTQYKEIRSEWAPNEKVALEAVIGASIAGVRSMASMKHVGLNVAADPLFTFSYTGVNAGMVVITADEPGQHSSQNEQDNRNYAKAAKIPMLEPSDSQEAKDMIKEAFAISEAYDTPVLVRMTTRGCHSKSIVEISEPVATPYKAYVKDVKKYVTVPANAREMRKKVEVREKVLAAYANESPYNKIENEGRAIGVIASGTAYCFAKEVFGEEVSYLKLGFTYPLPDQLIETFCQGKEKIYIIEENDPIIEERVKMLGFSCHGKDTFPSYGELTPDVIRKSVYGTELPVIEYDQTKIIQRPPTLCAGCPHRGFFYELGKRKNVMVAGDIGCYTLAFAEPYNAMDFNICMGASFSAGHGAKLAFDLKGEDKRVVSVLGDSTFFHTGINSLIEVLYNNSRTVNVILDNRITGMTGHQENPGSGKHANGTEAPIIDIETVVRALGAKHVAVINPNDLAKVKETLDWALSLDEPSVIITKWPCVLKKMSSLDQEQFAGAFKTKYRVDSELCIGCKLCTKAGCPALSVNPDIKKAEIDRTQCVGCQVCAQVCAKKAIVKEEN